MENEITTTQDNLIRFSSGDHSQKKSLQEKIRRFEAAIFELIIKLNQPVSDEFSFYFTQTEKMLALARQSCERNFYHVSDAFLKLGKDYLNQFKMMVD